MRGLKYIAGCKSDAIYTIELWKKDYTGAEIELALGKSPVLVMDKGDRIKGTSLEFSLVSTSVGMLEDLYTTDPYEFLTILKKGEVVIWQGYVVRELYRENYISAPYEIEVLATDGLGLLKDLEYNLTGFLTPVQFIRQIGIKIGLDLPIVFYSRIQEVGTTLDRKWIDKITFGVQDFAEDFYQALEKFLETINAYITQKNNHWSIERSSDMGHGLKYVNGVFDSEYSGSFTDLDIVGSLSLEIEPSKKNIQIDRQLIYPESILKNPFFREIGDWQLVGNVSYSFISGANLVVLTKREFGRSYITQEFQTWQGYQYTLNIDYSLISLTSQDSKDVDFEVRVSSPNLVLKSGGWIADKSGATSGITVRGRSELEIVAKREKLEIVFDSPSRLADCRVEIFHSNENYSLRIFECSLVVSAPKEIFLDTTINKNSIQDAKDFSIHISDRQTYPNLLNFWRKGTQLPINSTSLWKYNFGVDRDFNTLMAVDIISENIVIRRKISGKLKTLSDYYRDQFSSRFFYIERYNWDIYNGVVDVELIEIVPILNLTLQPFQEGEYIKGSTSGGGSSGASGGLSLGETETTAYRGDRGKIAYDHSQNALKHFDEVSGFGNLTKAGIVSHIQNTLIHLDTQSGEGQVSKADLVNIVGHFSEKADLNGDITQDFSAKSLITNKLVLNGVELTIDIL